MVFKEAAGSPPRLLPFPSCTSQFPKGGSCSACHSAVRVPGCARSERSLCFWRRRRRRRAEVLGSASSVCVFEWTKWRRSPRLTKVSGLFLPTRGLGSQPGAVLSLGFRRLRVASLVRVESARRGLLGSSAQAAARVMASSRTPGPVLCSALDVGVSEFCSDRRASLERLAAEDSGGGSGEAEVGGRLSRPLGAVVGSLHLEIPG